MAWFKVDDSLHSHPKWLVTPPSARGLWITAGAWSSAQLLDGHVPASALPTLNGRRRDADALVRAGLWKVSERGEGWDFHDWHDYQPTRQAVQTKRARQAERVQRWRERTAEQKKEPHLRIAATAVTHP